MKRDVGNLECRSNFAAWYKEWNYVTFAEGAIAPIFAWAAITVGIGPHF